jgi:hypothetical protein
MVTRRAVTSIMPFDLFTTRLENRDSADVHRVATEQPHPFAL